MTDVNNLFSLYDTIEVPMRGFTKNNISGGDIISQSQKKTLTNASCRAPKKGGPINRRGGAPPPTLPVKFFIYDVFEMPTTGYGTILNISGELAPQSPKKFY